MALLKYFSRDVSKCSKNGQDRDELESRIQQKVEQAKEEKTELTQRGKYNAYTPEQRAQIGKYASENGPTRAARHFSRVLNRTVPEPTARRLKSEYLKELVETKKRYNDGTAVEITVTELPTRHQGRPLLLGKALDTAVQEYVKGQRKLHAPINTTIVMCAAEAIVATRDRALLVEHGGHLKITKSWCKSLLSRMGYSKRKCTNAGKVPVYRLKELQGDFLADIQAEVLMNNIPPSMIFNWDQTALQLVPTGQWTMNLTGEKMIPIAHSDDKRQVTAVLAATLGGEFLPPQIIYQGKTTRCHPKVATVPSDWDIWHTENHWSNGDTMERYVEKIVVPFLNEKRATLKLDECHPALAIFDCFRGQSTPRFYSLLEKHNVIAVQVPANCTDQLQPLDVSINKPIKDEIKRSFQIWYANEIQKKLEENVPINEVKVDVSAPVIKNKSFAWFVSAWDYIRAHPEIIINGFRKPGILEAVNSLED